MDVSSWTSGLELESAKSSLIFEMTEKETTVSNAVIQSIIRKGESIFLLLWNLENFTN